MTSLGAPATDVKSRSGAQKAGSAALTAIGLAVAGIWDEVVFATPAVALTAKFGGWVTFASLVPIYIVIGSLISVSIIGFKQYKYAKRGRVAMFVSSMADRTEKSRLRKQLIAGSLVGFFLASWLLGGIITAWLLRQLGLRRNVVSWAVTANVIWAVMFLAQYCGLAALIFS